MSSHREEGCGIQHESPGTLWLPWKNGYGGFALGARSRYYKTRRDGNTTAVMSINIKAHGACRLNVFYGQ